MAMDIPLHPDTIRAMSNGREFMERVATARRAMANAKATATCPDGDNAIVIGDFGVIVDATFVEEVFTRYPNDDDLSDLLTAMMQDGFKQLSGKFDAATAAAHEDVRR